MKLTTMVVLVGVLAACSKAPDAPAPGLGKAYESAVGGVEKEVVSLVEAMPPDKFDFKPAGDKFDKSRTFAMQAKHIAAVNYILSAAMLKEKAPVELQGESGPDSVATPDQVVKFLKDSFVYAHKAALAITPENQMEMLQSPFGSGQMSRTTAAVILTSHPFDHYGQMVSMRA